MDDATIEIGVDTGGTFTDVVCRCPGKWTRIVKVPSTTADPSLAAIEAIRILSRDWKIVPQNVKRYVHGTTVATNAVLERKGARLGILTTKGFRDILEIGRQMRNALYDVILFPEPPVFLAPGKLRKEVVERISAVGEVLVPLDPNTVLAAVDELVKDGVEAIAICFLFSFLNPAHEVQARELINKKHPNLKISISSDVDPAFREYERTVVTAFDAYLKPVVDGYLNNLQNRLKSAGVPARLQVMQSRGGITSALIARERPVRLFLSGPAAGVIGGCLSGISAGITNIITVDVGGTSCDVALIDKGIPRLRSEGIVDKFPIRVPMVDVNSFGSGGGSIAWIDRAGGLHVGPQSAGSEPGPVAYGRGGTNPTVTDASLILGYIDPSQFAGGSLQLNVELAHNAIKHKIAEPLGLTVIQAAAGIHRVINARMAEGIRQISVRQGIDPRTYALLPLGGGGGLHACALATELDIRSMLIPRFPGVLSALGLLSASVEHEASAAFMKDFSEISSDNVATVLEKLDAECSIALKAQGVTENQSQSYHYADICYIGQAHHLELPIIQKPNVDVLKELYEAFLVAHEEIYGHSFRAPAKIVNLRSVWRSAVPTVQVEQEQSEPFSETLVGTREIFFDGAESPVAARIYNRDTLLPNFQLQGPAVLEQSDTTILIHGGWNARVLQDRSILAIRE